MALQDAGEELIAEFSDINIAIVTEYDLAREAGKSLIETEGDAHAGEIETSRILHSHPLLVKGKGEGGYPDFPSGILVREKRKYWPNGVWGDPSKASTEKGRLLEEMVVKRIVEIVRKMEVFTG